MLQDSIALSLGQEIDLLRYAYRVIYDLECTYAVGVVIF